MKAINDNNAQKTAEKRMLLNIGWWLGATIISLGIAWFAWLSTNCRPDYHLGRQQLGGLLLTILFFAQAFFHRILLNRTYPADRRKNVYSVVTTSIAVLLSVAMVLLITVSYSVRCIAGLW